MRSIAQQGPRRSDSRVLGEPRESRRERLGSAPAHTSPLASRRERFFSQTIPSMLRVDVGGGEKQNNEKQEKGKKMGSSDHTRWATHGAHELTHSRRSREKCVPDVTATAPPHSSPTAWRGQAYRAHPCNAHDACRAAVATQLAQKPKRGGLAANSASLLTPGVESSKSCRLWRQLVGRGALRGRNNEGSLQGWKVSQRLCR